MYCVYFNVRDVDNISLPLNAGKAVRISVGVHSLSTALSTL
jgi:hypothetical protein